MIDKFVTTYSTLRGRGEASKVNIRKINRWLTEYRNPINKIEIEFIKKPQTDLFTVVEHPRTPLHHALEKLHVFRLSLFRTNSRHNPNFTDGTVLHADERINGLVNAIISVGGFLMLAIPLWILYALEGRSKQQLIVITVFIGVFLTIVQSVLVAGPFESLAATAA